MELKPHDLVRVRGTDDLIMIPGADESAADPGFPDWVTASLHRAPFVVVRRAENLDGCVPIGIRGPQRGQRFPAWLPLREEVEIITPYSLATPVSWKAVYASFPHAAIGSLQRVTPLLQATGYRWGPMGGAGFELATGVETLKYSSDLDLVIDLPERITIQQVRSLISRLEKKALVYLDIQMNTPRGAVALMEYSKSEKVLIKTSSGPVLQPAHSLWS